MATARELMGKPAKNTIEMIKQTMSFRAAARRPLAGLKHVASHETAECIQTIAARSHRAARTASCIFQPATAHGKTALQDNKADSIHQQQEPKLWASTCSATSSCPSITCFHNMAIKRNPHIVDDGMLPYIYDVSRFMPQPV